MTEESLKEIGTNLEFYHINKYLEIDDEIKLNQNEKLLYVNYDSLKNNYVSKLADLYGDKLVVDNTQAFFSKNLPNIDTFYSLDSKFFGVQSGAYLYTNRHVDINFEYDIAYNRMIHLLGRLDTNASQHYDSYKESMKMRYNQEIKKMSRLTNLILKSIDYKKIKITRERNFYYLHNSLKQLNEFEVDLSLVEGPMFYPLLIKDENLRRRLISRKIFIPTFWPYLLSHNSLSEWENYLVKYLHPLPIDQRYNLEDMRTMMENIFEALGK